MNALQLKNRSPYAPPGMDGDGDEKLLSTVIAWAEKNSDKLHDIQTMCNVLKIPRNKIFALFKEKLQTTPHRWLREKQLQHARSLLESTTLPIKEIAGLCGFEHVEVFHRSFARQYGETPKQYRTTHFAYQDFMD
jgi:transcriptional regulator GlxA family with amidase domain